MRNSKIVDICGARAQADYSESFMIKAGYKNVKKEQVEDCPLTEVGGPGGQDKFFIEPHHYYEDQSVQLWVVTADIPNGLG